MSRGHFIRSDQPGNVNKHVGDVMSRKSICAVLTGDIIRANRLDDQEMNKVRSCLSDAVTRMQDWDRIYGGPDFFRGDSWQLMLTQPDLALRVAIYLRAAMRASRLSDTRIAIGLGHVNDMNPDQISQSTGEAFSLSKRGLYDMKIHVNMTVQLPKSLQLLSDWAPLMVHLCDAVINRWTRRQSEIAGLALDIQKPTHAEIAEQLSTNITRQAVSDSLKATNWTVIRDAVCEFEKTQWEFLLNSSS
ncbi:MAG: hypothetical protein U5R06_17715 [candidate division KSB1 bacterium]|nr:hypothetical protein [candidate division KSB1 bacterium]